MMLAGKVAISRAGRAGIGPFDSRQVRCRGGEGRGVRHQSGADATDAGGDTIEGRGGRRAYPVDVTKKETLAAMVKAVMPSGAHRLRGQQRRHRHGRAAEEHDR